MEAPGPDQQEESRHDETLRARVQRKILGAPRDVTDPNVLHKISLIAFLAWVGLGADGLSSSSYGPEEAFRTLGNQHYLALVLAFATGITVLILSASYSSIIEQFPTGGGGYVVASRLLGPNFGVISGCALVVDYVLTITTSIASGGDAIFSFLPLSLETWKLPAEFATIVFLITLNIRGVKESVKLLTPIFIIFLITHAVLIGCALGAHAGQIPAVSGRLTHEYQTGISTLGFWGLAILFLRAYSLGGGTYTGIEAVSNGLQIMREPRVQTGKKTMLYMALSLAITASGILLCYLLLQTRPVANQTMNAVLAAQVFGRWHLGSLPIGYWLILVTLISEGFLLFVAAQAGFIDGPRVMANMAVDSYFPHRFAALSEQLSMQNGVLLMGGAALAMLFYTRGNIHILVVMYSINVFLTFTLTQLGMVRHWWKLRATEPRWRVSIGFNALGAIATAVVAAVVGVAKFALGAWMVLVLIPALIAVMWGIHRHYRRVEDALFVRAASRLEALSPVVLVPIGRLDRATLRALAVARALSPEIIALHVSSDQADATRFEEQIARLGDPGVRGVVIESPYRALGNPLLAYLDTLDREDPGRPITVVLSEYVPAHWWEWFLHNQLALRLKLALFFRPNTTVLDVPFRFDRD